MNATTPCSQPTTTTPHPKKGRFGNFFKKRLFNSAKTSSRQPPPIWLKFPFHTLWGGFHPTETAHAERNKDLFEESANKEPFQLAREPSKKTDRDPEDSCVQILSASCLPPFPPRSTRRHRLSTQVLAQTLNHNDSAEELLNDIQTIKNKIQEYQYQRHNIRGGGDFGTDDEQCAAKPTVVPEGQSRRASTDALRTISHSQKGSSRSVIHSTMSRGFQPPRKSMKSDRHHRFDKPLRVSTTPNYSLTSVPHPRPPSDRKTPSSIKSDRTVQSNSSKRSVRLPLCDIRDMSVTHLKYKDEDNHTFSGPTSQMSFPFPAPSPVMHTPPPDIEEIFYEDSKFDDFIEQAAERALAEHVGMKTLPSQRRGHQRGSQLNTLRHPNGIGLGFLPHDTDGVFSMEDFWDGPHGKGNMTSAPTWPSTSNKSSSSTCSCFQRIPTHNHLFANRLTGGSGHETPIMVKRRGCTSRPISKDRDEPNPSPKQGHNIREPMNGAGDFKPRPVQRKENASRSCSTMETIFHPLNNQFNPLNRLTNTQ